ncbi:magnesium transporter CorA family protein [Neobacillus niacini]|uniref:magnesium transporter CorA family protein n=1 Tax=Neobacillus niacini TaxID=86668 RepID=UPI0021CAE9CF|nr:magnesium transporter CorA family protein [Neobacillus niacini]MCM3763994.1 magnesium transporter CorA family protein [Neobacillus niacini]
MKNLTHVSHRPVLIKIIKCFVKTRFGNEILRLKGGIWMETLFGKDKWKWVQAQPEETKMPINDTNRVRVSCLDNGEKAVRGSLVYRQDFSKEKDYQIFHFQLTREELVTVDLDWEAPDPDLFQRQLDRMETAVDGFLFFLGELVNDLLVEIDQFEAELKKLVWCVRNRNETGILELVYKRRHELMVAKGLLIPLNELRMVIDEINLHSSSTVYEATSKRMERALFLLREYEQTLDSMINLEEVISSHRGNEIMKTLTVMTTVFTPVMAFGALWGMNFKHMPELQWPFGYGMSLVLIGVSTALLYAYLKMKGWTGDLLKGKKKGSFFK